MGAVSFDSDHSGGDGASTFFSGQYFDAPSPSTIVWCILLCAGVGLERTVFLATLLISGVAGHVPVRSSLLGSLTLHGVGGKLDTGGWDGVMIWEGWHDLNLYSWTLMMV